MAFGSDRQLTRLTERRPDFSIEDAYSVALRVCELRRLRGERLVGRKIGATNRTMWPILGVTGPNWGFAYDSTVFDLTAVAGNFDLAHFRQPRIEPEIVLHLATTPQPGMSESDLLRCIDKVAHGFELVHSPFSDWKVSAPDAVAAYGLHMALLLGPWHPIRSDLSAWGRMLRDFTIELSSSDGTRRQGAGHNVLDSPVLALQFLVDDLASQRLPRLQAGEVVTTGTLTEAMPVQPGETWTTEISGAPFDGLSVKFQ